MNSVKSLRRNGQSVMRAQRASTAPQHRNYKGYKYTEQSYVHCPVHSTETATETQKQDLVLGALSDEEGTWGDDTP